jgi:hypothetical protein
MMVRLFFWCCVAFAILVCLKLLGVLACSWGAIFLPLWLIPAFIVGLLLLLLAILCIAGVFCLLAIGITMLFHKFN